MRSLLKISILFPVLLAAIATFLSIQNFAPNTYLSGWDTLHPEFDFMDYFKRTLSVWQEHQGLGAVASQAHAAELPRLILLYPLSFILSSNFLRYFYFFLTLIIGPLGVYFFVKESVLNNPKPFFREVSSFSASLFYLLNLTTLQNYFVPLEMFATHYALLGWIFLLATKFIKSNQKNHLIIFSFLILLNAPSAHTPTLFYAFLLIFSFYALIFNYLSNKKLKESLLLIGVIIVINSFWILPNLYYVKNYGESVANSKIHYQFSDRAFQTGKNFGNFSDTAILKNFLFDWGEYDDKKGLFVQLLSPWDSHLRRIDVSIIGYLLFTISLTGLFLAVVNKQKVALAFLPVFAVPYFFINNDNIFFQEFIDFIQTKLPVVKESLRFPYTKFSILLLFSYCVYFAYSLSYFLDFISKNNLIKKYLPERLAGWVVLILISVCLIYYMLPAFFGNLIDDKMKVKIPDEYFQTYKFFRTQNPNQRIAPFPIHTFWGWVYYKWNYEGAGFNWFGLRQPLLDREFDRWIPYNENYYWESSYAFYSQNLTLFEKVLEKYQVSWLMVDENIIDASSAKSTYLTQFQQLISDSKKIVLEKQIGNIKIYNFLSHPKTPGGILLKNTLPKAGPAYYKNNLDAAFIEKGNYVSISDQENSAPDIYYPFRSLFSNTNPELIEFKVEETENSFIFTKKLPDKLKGYELTTPNFQGGGQIWIDKENLDIRGSFNPTISYDGKHITVITPKLKGYYSVEIDPARDLQKYELKNCNYISSLNDYKSRSIKNEVVQRDNKKYLSISSTLANNCSVEFLLANLSHDFGYIISIESKNVEGKSLLFWLENLNIKKPDIEVYLPQNKKLNKTFFIQPPMEKYGQGYFLHFDNWSFNKTPSVNELGKIEVYPLPYEVLAAISLEKKTPNIPQNNCSFTTNKKTAYFYQIEINKDCDPKDKTLILSQSFDGGWFGFSGIKPISKHVLVNNWSNGWILDSTDKSITLFFIPQLLEFFGFIIAGSSLIYVFKRNKPLIT